MENYELTHWGIKGMRWGHRRFQNKDGTLTPAGRERYYDADDMESYHKERERAKKKERNKRLITAAVTALATVGVVYGIKKFSEGRDSPQAATGEDLMKQWMSNLKESSIKPKEAKKKPYVSPEISTDKLKKTMQTVPGVKPLWERKSNLPKTLDGGKVLSQKISDFMGGNATTIGKPLWGGGKMSAPKAKSTPKFSLKSDQELAKMLSGRAWSHDGLEGGTTFDNESEDLSHWGIKGMKWGIRRFQNKDGSLTPEGKKRYGDDELDEQALKEAKDRAVKSGNIDRVKAYRSEMSNDELRKALERVDLEKRIRDIEDRQRKTGLDKFNSTINKVDTIRSSGEKLVNAYNLIAKINNSFNTKFSIPSIDGNAKSMMDKYTSELVKSGSIDKIVENFGNLSVSQLGDAAKRFAYEDTLRKRLEQNKK